MSRNRCRCWSPACTVTTLRDGIDHVDVVARATPQERGDLGAARRHDDRIARRRAGAGLAGRARSSTTHEEPILWRRNRDMRDHRARRRRGRRAGAGRVDAHLAAACARSAQHLPPGYRIEMGGAIEESAKGNASIFAVFPVMILVMLTIVMVQLQNFTRVGLVMMSAPLGLIGASLALNLAGAPFGFVALLGLIALSGMDMRNSIILVDQVRQDLERGANYREAIIERDGAARAAGGADGARRHPRHDSAVALRLLGADGAHHHGRAVRRDLSDGAVPAGALRAWFRRHLGDAPGRSRRPRARRARPTGLAGGAAE